ncbi:hypothetical protein SVAN01_01202 [Stagonosporopsis vannaccii]|nr:hypothetical protein SVAN01_01202 [Stagonosporopsis vannaccii]
MSLGKRKRDEYDLVESETKRRKMDLTSRPDRPCHTINPFFAILIPTPKPPSFPLFKLPAELRAEIWNLVWGQQIIHVSLKSYNKPAEASAADLKYTIHRKSTYPHYATALVLPPRVSKRFYVEATAALYASSTFSFHAPHAFRAFALSGHPCVSRVQHLTIPRLTNHWTDALVSSLVGRLTGLRGVHLTHQHQRCSAARPLPHAMDATWRDYWRMIRAFQQHELEAHKTEFEMVVLNVSQRLPFDMGSWTMQLLGLGDPQYKNLLRLREEFTNGLLEFTPRRLSRRGAKDT